mmetsp:Transcript_31158/g.52652  ORF Transcript_31158/g.52652 Transcript_31158/m.52652 type:complete len:203 (+) Transcript_31158:944-1552(+)
MVSNGQAQPDKDGPHRRPLVLPDGGEVIHDRHEGDRHERHGVHNTHGPQESKEVVELHVRPQVLFSAQMRCGNHKCVVGDWVRDRQILHHQPSGALQVGRSQPAPDRRGNHAHKHDKGHQNDRGRCDHDFGGDLEHLDGDADPFDEEEQQQKIDHRETEAHARSHPDGHDVIGVQRVLVRVGGDGAGGLEQQEPPGHDEDFE